MAMNTFHNSNLSDIELNEQGLQQFNAGRYDEAIVRYNKAIVKNPSVPAYFTNRAQCYLKLKRWESACQDCQNAITLNSYHAKGYHFLGLAQLELQLYDEAIKNIFRAYFAALEQNDRFLTNYDVSNEAESAINRKRASQGKKAIAIGSFTTKTKSITKNGKKNESREVRLRFRKNNSCSRCISNTFSTADEIYHV